MNSKQTLSQWLYVIGAGMLFVLAVVCMLSFLKALSYKENHVEKSQKSLADSLQVVQLQTEVKELKTKVDSLISIVHQEPKVKYRYIKPRKDSCVIELNINQ